MAIKEKDWSSQSERPRSRETSREHATPDRPNSSSDGNMLSIEGQDAVVIETGEAFSQGRIQSSGLALMAPAIPFRMAREERALAKKYPSELLRTFPLSAGLLDPQHIQAIDPKSPLWVYLWMVSHVTRDEPCGESFLGTVLYGRPVSIREIAADLGMEYRACRRHLARLVKAGYLLQKKTGMGTCTYAVTRSKRWAWKRRKASERNCVSNFPEPPASFWPQAQGPTYEKLASGSGPTDQISVKADQEVVGAERGTRARSHKSQEKANKGSCETSHEANVPILVEKESPPVSKCARRPLDRPNASSRRDLDEHVRKIAAEYPKLRHLKDRALPRICGQAIAEAIVRDGPDTVLAGTQKFRDSVNQWPEDEMRFVPNPERFYRESQYLQDGAVWQRSKKQSKTAFFPLPNDYVPASETIRRERSAGVGR